MEHTTPTGITPESAWQGRRLTVVTVTVAALLLTWLVTAGRQGAPGPETVVRDFLTAARDGDVDTALELADVVRSEDESDRFLTGEAVAGEWSISGVRVESIDQTYADTDYDDKIEEAMVEYTIAVPDEESISGWLRLTRPLDSDVWKIHDALASVKLPHTPLWYVDLNGVIAPDATQTETDNEGYTEVEPATYRLLPGIYQLYRDAPELIDVADSPGLVFPGQGEAGTPYAYSEAETFTLEAPAMTLTDAGERAAQDAVNALIDRCAQATELELEGCPFASDATIGPETADGTVDDHFDIEWTVDEYPVVAVVAGEDGIAVADRQRGRVTVDFSGYESVSTDDGLARGAEVTVSATCEIRTGELQIGIESDGSMRVIPQGFRFRPWPGESRYPGDGDTCE